MIALLILSAGIFGLALIQITAVKARSPLASAGLRTATDLAQEALDRLQNVEWNALRSSSPEGFEQGSVGISPAFSRLPTAAGDDVSVGGTVYYRIWRVAQDPEIPNLKNISVWCCWKPGDGRWRQVFLVTQRSDAER